MRSFEAYVVSNRKLFVSRGRLKGLAEEGRSDEDSPTTSVLCVVSESSCVSKKN